MIKRSETFLKQFVVLLDMAVLIVAFLGAYHLRHTFHHFSPAVPDSLPFQDLFAPLKPLDSYLWLLLILLPLWIGALSLTGGYRELRLKSYGRIVWLILKASCLGLLFFGSIVFIFKLHYLSRSFIGLFFLLGGGLLSFERGVLLACFHVMLQRGYFHRNLLIVGTGPRAVEFIKTVRSHRGWGLRIVGVLDEPPMQVVVGEELDGIKVLGTLPQLSSILQRYVVDEVIFVVPRSWMSRIEQAILECERAGVRATVAVDLFNMQFTKAQSTDLGGIPLISFDSTPVNQWQLAIKRAIDVLVSGIGLLLLLPLFPIVLLLIKATSPGPVLFRQVRCGLNGRRFTLYKFRSMVADAEAKQVELAHLNELSGPVFKATNDPRLTAVGRWLRKTSVDELPQLFNVLKGEMSLVGPRPPIPSEVERYEPWQRRRLSMRPGITGYWQVNGRNGLTHFDEWMHLDLEYIDRWSLGLDAKILLKTIPAVVFGIGAK